MKTAKRIGWITGVLFGLILAGCQASGGGGTTAANPAPEAQVADATTAVVSSLDVSQLASTFGEAASLKASMDSQGSHEEGTTGSHEGSDVGDDEEGEELEDDEESEEDEIECTYDSESDSATCPCPEGGTVKHTFSGDKWDENTRTWSVSFTTIMDQCRFKACGTEPKTISGKILGEASGTETPEGYKFTAVHGTEGECSGITIDDVQVGMQITMSVENDQESLSGYICFDPPGEVITFNSHEELRKLVDPEGICRKEDHQDGAASH